MSSRHVFSALSVLLLSCAGALGAVETRTITITNNTANHWAKVVFYIHGPLLAEAGPVFAAHFIEDMSLHSASAGPVSKFIADPGINDILVFDYSGFSTLSPGGTYEFTLSINNPLDAVLEIGWRTFAGQPQVPAPGACIVLGAAAFARRRRRSN